MNQKNIIFNKINFLKDDFLKRFDEINCEWENYSEFYMGYIYSTTLGIKNQLEKFIEYLDFNKNSADVQNFELDVMGIINIYSGQNLLKHFGYRDRNYVILGRNGAGKTRLLKRISQDYFSFNALVIPATRNILFSDDNARWNQYSNIDLYEIFKKDDLYVNDILTYKLCIERNDLCHDVENIFNSLSFGRKMFIDCNCKSIYLYSEKFENKKYNISGGSDGEKTAFLFISLTLLCNLNSLILIDEPENHLNTALLNELFDILEKKRRDITFIYCTHNVDFIELRNKPNLIYLSGYSDINDGEWDLKDLESFDSLSIQNIVDIAGTKKKYCLLKASVIRLIISFILLYLVILRFFH